MLQLASLKRYRHIFKLGDVPGGTKEDLIPAIQRHFAQQVRLHCMGSTARYSGTLLAGAAQANGPKGNPSGAVLSVDILGRSTTRLVTMVKTAPVA